MMTCRNLSVQREYEKAMVECANIGFNSDF